jgi:hypothetical protein
VRRAALLVLLTAAAALPASPAAARPRIDLGVTQSVSSHIVKPGETVEISATVTNHGDEAQEAFVELGSLRAHGRGANDPYLSSSTTQGTCTPETGNAYGYTYQWLLCKLGPIAPGTSVEIHARVQINETAVHSATILANAYEGGYFDDEPANNAAHDRITASVPPVLTGSKKIKLLGLPSGCVEGDFPLTIVAKAPGVKKIRVSAWELDWERTASGRRLHVTVPVTKITEPVLGASYKIKIKAKRGAAGALERTVEFQLC